MGKIITRIKDWLRGVPLGAVGRSSQWGSVRKAFLVNNPTCAVCEHDKVSVHHIVPFHKDKSLETTFSNLITLCEGIGTRNHHFEFGHLNSWKSWNEDVIIDSIIWKQKIKSRP